MIQGQSSVSIEGIHWHSTVGPLRSIAFKNQVWKKFPVGGSTKRERLTDYVIIVCINNYAGIKVNYMYLIWLLAEGEGFDGAPLLLRPAIRKSNDS